MPAADNLTGGRLVLDRARGDRNLPELGQHVARDKVTYLLAVLGGEEPVLESGDRLHVQPPRTVATTCDLKARRLKMAKLGEPADQQHVRSRVGEPAQASPGSIPKARPEALPSTDQEQLTTDQE